MDREEYERLRDEFLDDPRVKYASFHAMKAEHPIYQRFRREGREILPFLFSDIVSEDRVPSQFGLIEDILGTRCPHCPSEERGKLDVMQEHFVRWGKELGYIEG